MFSLKHQSNPTSFEKALLSTGKSAFSSYIKISFAYAKPHLLLPYSLLLITFQKIRAQIFLWNS